MAASTAQDVRWGTDDGERGRAQHQPAREQISWLDHGGWLLKQFGFTFDVECVFWLSP